MRKKVMKPRRTVERKPHIPYMPKQRKHKQDCDVSVHDANINKTVK